MKTISDTCLDRLLWQHGNLLSRDGKVLVVFFAVEKEWIRYRPPYVHHGNQQWKTWNSNSKMDGGEYVRNSLCKTVWVCVCVYFSIVYGSSLSSIVLLLLLLLLAKYTHSSRSSPQRNAQANAFTSSWSPSACGRWPTVRVCWRKQQGGRKSTHVRVIAAVARAIENKADVPHADARWRHIDHFIVTDVGHHIFQRHGADRRKTNVFVLKEQIESVLVRMASRNAVRTKQSTYRSGRTHVGELLLLRWVHFNVRWTTVLANDHTSVHFITRLDKHFAAVFQSIQRVSLQAQTPQGQCRVHAPKSYQPSASMRATYRRNTVRRRDQLALGWSRRRALEWRVAVENRVQHTTSARVRLDL